MRRVEQKRAGRLGLAIGGMSILGTASGAAFGQTAPPTVSFPVVFNGSNTWYDSTYQTSYSAVTEDSLIGDGSSTLYIPALVQDSNQQYFYVDDTALHGYNNSAAFNLYNHYQDGQISIIFPDDPTTTGGNDPAWLPASQTSLEVGINSAAYTGYPTSLTLVNIGTSFTPYTVNTYTFPLSSANVPQPAATGGNQYYLTMLFIMSYGYSGAGFPTSPGDGQTFFIGNLQFTNPQSVNATWTSNVVGSGAPDWSGGNGQGWANATYPEYAGDIANFGSAITQPLTIPVDSNYAMGQINFNNSNSYTLIPEGTLGLLTLDNGGPAATAQINDLGGTHYIQTPVVLNSSLSVTVTNSSDVLNLTGNISGVGGITLSGSGKLVLGGSNSYAGGTTVDSGTLVINSANALPAGSGVTNNSFLDFEASATSGKISGNGLLIVGSGNHSTVQLAPGNGTSTVGSLFVGSGSSLDLTNNPLIVNYGTGTTPLTSIQSYLTDGFNSGWTAGEIFSSSVASLNASQSALIYSVGYADGSDGITSIPSGQIEILPTLAGDAKMQGNVVFGDFQLLSQYFGQSNTTWDEGNFTYGSTTNFGDFQLLSQNFGASSVNLTSSELASINSFAAQFGEKIGPDGTLVSVPEPASGGILAITGISLLARRRSNRRG